jgi:hypothetical protein
LSPGCCSKAGAAWASPSARRARSASDGARVILSGRTSTRRISCKSRALARVRI